MKTLEVIRYEFNTNLRRPSFLFFMFGLPILIVVVYLIFSLAFNNKPSTTGETAEQITPSEEIVEGYVDRSGIIRQIPSDIPPGRLVGFTDEASATAALEKGEIDSYYLIPADYIESGKIVIVLPRSKSLASSSPDWLIRWTLLVNLFDGDAQLAQEAWSPAVLQEVDLAIEEAGGAEDEGKCLTPGTACESSWIVQYLPLIVLIMLFVIITGGSGMMFTSVVSERQNRTIEVMMVSLHPRQILAGKFIGLGLLALLQNIVWMGTVFFLLRVGGTTLRLPEGFSLPVSLLVWWVLFYLGGYAVYASLMAGAGALANNLKESSSVSYLVLLPLLLGYSIGAMYSTVGNQHHIILTILSLFPLTAPVVMMLRLTMGGVPFWQPLLAAALLLITVIIILRMVARMFRTSILLSGQPFSLKRYFRMLFGRETG